MKKTKDYSLIMALGCMCLLVIGHMISVMFLVVLSIGLYLCLLMFSRDENILPLLLFFLPWSTIIKLTPDSISFASIATILVFFALLFSKKTVNGPILLAASALVFITLFSKIVQNYNITASYIMNMFMILAFPMILFWTKEKVSFRKSILFFSIGIISGSLLSFIVLDNANIGKFVGSFSDLQAKRSCGFYSDPNYFSAHALTAIGGLLLVEHKNKDEAIIKIILIICLMVLGLTSISKSFLISLLLLLALLGSRIFFKSPKKMLTLIVAVAFVGGILLSTGFMSEIINNYIFRFDSAGDASGLTTGRSDIWKDYIVFLLENPVKFFIGQGYTDDGYSIMGVASHNTILQLIYQLGCIGAVLFIIWLRCIFPWKQVKKIPFSYLLIWIVACFNMWLGLDMMFLDDMYLIIVLFCMGIHYLSITDKKIRFNNATGNRLLSV